VKLLIRKFCSTLALLCIASFRAGGGGSEKDTPSSNAINDSLAKAETASAVRHLTLPHSEPNVPVAPGRDEFMRACETCHSARYVTMQPPFSRRQWEDTVRKMITAYGAPADEFQIGKIIDYLYAIDGNGPRPQTHDSSSDDDESDAAPSLALPEATESAPVFQVVANAQEHDLSVRRGKEVFDQNCAGCHGDDGQGKGVAGQALLPKPANLTAARFSDEFLRQTLWNGVRGVPMPSWRTLPLRDLSAVAAYVQSLHSGADSSTVAPESLARGGALYLKNCLACHGSTGDGKGSTAATLTPPPSNFKAIQPDFDYILKVLRDGIPGTSMPVWKDQISESDSAALAGYVRSLYEADKRLNP
jgi:mono/diheme cytochrome c family protein